MQINHRDDAGPLRMGPIAVPSVVEDEFNDWSNPAYPPPILRFRGCVGARGYLAIESQPKYLTPDEFESAQVAEHPEWEKTRGTNPWSKRIRPTCATMSDRPPVYCRVLPT